MALAFNSFVSVVRHVTVKRFVEVFNYRVSSAEIGWEDFLCSRCKKWADLFGVQLPPKPSEPSQAPSVPPGGAAAGYNPYSPAVSVSASSQQANAPPPAHAPLNIGFENLSSMLLLFFAF